MHMKISSNFEVRVVIISKQEWKLDLHCHLSSIGHAIFMIDRLMILTASHIRFVIIGTFLFGLILF